MYSFVNIIITFSDAGTVKTLILNGQEQGDSVTFLLTCKEACQNVIISLEVDSGDPDLFGKELSPPVITDRKCDACYLMNCDSKLSGRFESCAISILQTNTFYVTVYASKAYRNGTINFRNVLSVEQYGKNI